jgi:uncharacterized protein YbcI
MKSLPDPAPRPHNIPTPDVAKAGRLTSVQAAIADPDVSQPSSGDVILVQVAAAVARCYHERFGRAPAQVRAAFCSQDALVVIARGVLTHVERSCDAPADDLRLRESRTLLQYASPSTFTEPVEKVLGRRVLALVSGIDVPSDVATETFILEPQHKSNAGMFSADRRARTPERREFTKDRRSHTDHSTTPEER